MDVQSSFYSCGFIYDASSHQVLLQQFTENNASALTLFRANGQKGENPVEVFKKLLKKTLRISLSDASIVPVYDYIHDEFGSHFIFYAHIKNGEGKKLSQAKNAAWCPLTKLAKLNVSPQARHDIMVGERVIRAVEEKLHPAPRKN